MTREARATAPDHALPPRLAALWLSRVTALTGHLASAFEGDRDGVRKARVASRRLREVLPILSPVVTARFVRHARRRLRRLTASLGALREADVLVDLLARHDLDAPVKRRLARRATARRRAAWKALVADWPPRRRASLERTLVRIGEQLDVRGDGDGPGGMPGIAWWMPTLADRLDRRADALLSRCDGLPPAYVSELAHEVRLAAKKLRYAIELAGAAGVGGVDAPIATLKRHQDWLGHLHDLDVLASLIARLDRSRAAGVDERSAPGDAAIYARHRRGRRALRAVAVLVQDRIAPALRGAAPDAASLPRAAGRR